LLLRAFCQIMNETPKPIINAAAQKIITSQLLNIPVNSIIFIVLVYINKKPAKFLQLL